MKDWKHKGRGRPCAQHIEANLIEARPKYLSLAAEPLLSIPYLRFLSLFVAPVRATVS